MQSDIQNLSLPVIQSDLCICRVGGDFYIATLNFEWSPAVRIYQSKDLIYWAHRGYALRNATKPDSHGNSDSSGVWAPYLSHAHGLFWLTYTDVRNARNYLVVASDIDGQWSEPIFLDSFGFDSNLFHDDDGKSWLLNQQRGHDSFFKFRNEILLQEFDSGQGKLIGEIKTIFQEPAVGAVFGPKIYKRNGWYYLIATKLASSFFHTATIARSRQLDGPYEVMPETPILGGSNSLAPSIQAKRRGTWNTTEEGEWYMLCLHGPPLEFNSSALSKVQYENVFYHSLQSIFGREIEMHKFFWRDDDWPELVNGRYSKSEFVIPPKKRRVSRKPKKVVMCDHRNLSV